MFLVPILSRLATSFLAREALGSLATRRPLLSINWAKRVVLDPGAAHISRTRRG